MLGWASLSHNDNDADAEDGHHFHTIINNDAGDTLRIFRIDALHLIALKEEIDAKDELCI